MAKVRVRQKNQITIPLRIAEEANIKPDDMLEIRYANVVIALMPHGRKERKRSVMDYAGIARGTWGKTIAEIEEELKRDRESWER
ncbi:MAG: AbrB/MazE/SpoVT family DNA-binding domain-containing protein [Chlorobium sp.]|nr:AbrB/MazE/SpoVT family DNA-binding domain-containing protein [Chlorobium sp.]